MSRPQALIPTGTLRGRTRGRPAVLTPEVAEDICSRVAIGEALTTIARDRKLALWTILRWEQENRDGFGEALANARKIAGHSMAAKVLEISEAVAKRKLTAPEARAAMDGFRWLAERFNPAQYGDKATSGGIQIVIESSLFANTNPGSTSRGELVLDATPSISPPAMALPGLDEQD